MAGSSSYRTPNETLITLRENRALSQQELAEELNRLATTSHGAQLTLTKKSVYRWECGETTFPKRFYQQLLAEYFGVPIAELGFKRPHLAPATAPAITALAGADEPTSPSPEVEREQQRWRETRAALGTTRRALAITAEGLYPDFRLPGLHNTGVIAHQSWIPQSPVSIQDITLTLASDTPPPEITGGEAETADVRPWSTPGHRYRRYHDVIRDLTPPKLFENRLCFRLTHLEWTTPEIGMHFGHMGFFDSMDTNEALAHETALRHLMRDHNDELSTMKPSWRRLPFRTLIGDPFDLSRRPLMGAVGTLTIRGGESPSVVLHQRDGNKVAGGGGMTHLLPAGIFQPSSVLPAAIAADFSLWRNIQRELAEELLGHDEYDGSGHPIAYNDLEPFATLDRALDAGDIQIWCLGVTLDALTLCGDILTAAVIAPDLYDHLFADAVNTNSEGTVPARALPFEENTLRYLREEGRLSPGAAAALHLAWNHRHVLFA
ncbi:helix-turn-helix domain-containing protein [Amycolatopsis sp. cmx-4-68]|uniref:helix-turn-helix domain-containing protein n=1 Tax=Amycolatopsis sp. cmx-4-68 TaxID=2790938 RepID=UPI003978B5A1